MVRITVRAQSQQLDDGKLSPFSETGENSVSSTQGAVPTVTQALGSDLIRAERRDSLRATVLA
jgi:hypothetical protein